jgi:hypothetical protein
LYWESLDGEWIVYEEASNQTMVLDAASMDILLSLKAGELDEVYLESQILEDLELDTSDENRAFIHSAIHNLASIGLVIHSKDAAFPDH